MIRVLTICSVLFVFGILSAAYAIAFWPQTPNVQAPRAEAADVQHVSPSERKAERTAQSLAATQALKSRLLFSQARKPQPAKTAVQHQATKASAQSVPAFVLKGTMVADDKQVALIFDPGQVEVISAAVGQTLDQDWKIVGIEPGGATLRKGTRTINLTLAAQPPVDGAQRGKESKSGAQPPKTVSNAVSENLTSKQSGAEKRAAAFGGDDSD